MKRITRLTTEALDVAAALENKGMLVIHSGSFFTCDPPHLFSDVDLFIHESEVISNLRFFPFDVLENLGFKANESGEYEMAGAPAIACVRRGKINVIYVASTSHFEKIKIATAICKAANLHRKVDRVRTFTEVQRSILTEWTEELDF